MEAVRHITGNQYELRSNPYDAIRELQEHARQTGEVFFFLLGRIPVYVDAESDPRLLAEDVNRAEIGLIGVVGPRYSNPSPAALAFERKIAAKMAAVDELIMQYRQLG